MLYASLRIVIATTIKKKPRTNAVPLWITSLEPKNAPNILANPHDHASGNHNMAAQKKGSQSNHVTRKVKNLGVCSGFFQVEPQHDHEDNRPEGSCSRAKKAVVKSQHQTGTNEKNRSGQIRSSVQLSQIRRQPGKKKDPYQEKKDDMLQKIR